MRPMKQPFENQESNRGRAEKEYFEPPVYLEVVVIHSKAEENDRKGSCQKQIPSC